MGHAQHTVYSRALARAAEILGGSEALGAHLQVHSAQVEVWMSGLEAPPQHIFLKVVDLLSERNLTELRRGLPADR